MRGRLRAGVGVALMVASLLPAPAGAVTFGALEVSGPDFVLLSMPYNLTVGRSLFQTPGDVNGDGFDDIMVWRGTNGSTRGFVLYNGTASGLDLANARARNGGPFGALADTGWLFSYDQRPTGVDVNGDGMADVVGHLYQANVCGEWPVGGSPGVCLPMVLNELIVAIGNVSAPLQNRIDILPALSPGSDWAPLHMTEPLSHGDRAAFVVERELARSADGRTPGGTSFDVYAVRGNGRIDLAWSWNVSEPTPMAQSPRPPRFIAAPDFDRDGYADIVTWSTPGQGPSGPLPGIVTIYNGTAAGLEIGAPVRLELSSPVPLFGDFDHDGHKDIAGYQVTNLEATVPAVPHVDVDIHLWFNETRVFELREHLRLEGPSIFLSQPPLRLQVGDIDGDGADDLVTAKYDTTSASTGHILVDVFLRRWVCSDCDMDPHDPNPDFSTEIQITGTDINANEGSLRVNLQGDFDGDGQRDITVGFYGGNAPRAPTSQSGFVAVLYGRKVAGAVYGVSIDADPGGVVYPMYRNYTITMDLPPYDGTVRIEFPGAVGAPTLEVNASSLSVTSSAPSKVVAAGPAARRDITCTAIGCPAPSFTVPIAFNWSFPTDQAFGLLVRTQQDASAPLVQFARLPRAATFHAVTEITGGLSAESEGRDVVPGGWVRGGALVNFSSTLGLQFQGSDGIQPREPPYWRLLGPPPLAVYAGDLNVGLTAPTLNRVPWVAKVDFEGLPYQAGSPFLDFEVSVDATPPSFGAHLPLDSEWVTSLPAFAAVQVFDNESGVDPARIEYAWARDGSPASGWLQADYQAGQTAAEVVGSASIGFPEGGLSTLVWRSWDLAGNGPVESPTYGVKVDTQDLTFYDPHPAPTEWANDPEDIDPWIWINSGPSGLNWSSVQYRFSSRGLFGYGNWTGYCDPPPPSPPGAPLRTCGHYVHITDGVPDYTRGVGFGVQARLAFEQGDENWIQWRAANNASGELKLSEPYRIRVDSKPAVIEWISPNETVLLPLGPVTLTVAVHEGSPRGVAQRGLNLSHGAAIFRVRGPGAADFGPSMPLNFTLPADDLWRNEFAAPFVFERGSSGVEVSVSELGGATTTTAMTVRVNQQPTALVSSVPSNFTVLVNGTIELTVNATDADGQPLSFAWQVYSSNSGCSFGGRIPPPIVTLSREPTIEFNASSHECARTDAVRNFTVMLVVRDGLDGLTGLAINVRVVDVLPTPPSSSSAVASARHPTTFKSTPRLARTALR